MFNEQFGLLASGKRGRFLFKLWRAYQGLAFHLAQPKFPWRGSAADAIALPQLEPGAVRQLRIMPLVGRRDIAGSKRTYVRHIEDSLQFLDVADGSFDVHAGVSIDEGPSSVCYFKWLLMAFVILNMSSFLAPKTGCSFSSAMISRLFSGF